MRANPKVSSATNPQRQRGSHEFRFDHDSKNVLFGSMLDQRFVVFELMRVNAPSLTLRVS